MCSALNELTRCERIDSYFPTDDDVQNYYNHYSVLRTRHTSIYCEFHYQPKVIKISFLFFKPRIPTTYMYYIIMFINNRSFANMFCSENVLFIHFGICWKEEFIGTIFLRIRRAVKIGWRGTGLKYLSLPSGSVNSSAKFERQVNLFSRKNDLLSLQLEMDHDLIPICV